MAAIRTATATAAAATIASLRRNGIYELVPKYVADAADRVQEPWLSAFLRLAAQVAHVDPERVRGRAEVVTPNVLEDRRAREHLARVAHEQLQQQELGLGQLDQAVSTADLVSDRVELEVGVAEHLAVGGAVAGAAQQRARASLKL